jgi:hypothetical protein
LAVIPDDWALDWYSNIKYPDNNVLHNGNPSIRLEPSTDSENPAREVDHKYVGTWPYCDLQVKLGDHIIFKCWIKIDPLPSGYDYEDFAGARIGFDLNAVVNGARVNLYGLSAPTYPQTDDGIVANYVHWGTEGWVQRTIDFVISSDTFTYDYYSGTTIPATQISQIAPWMQVWSSKYGGTEPGNAWFADAELYINP